MFTIDTALEANRRFASTFAPGERPPRPSLALLLCMDARIEPIQALGIPYGYAHIIRNAGGRVADAIRSLAISQTLIGTQEVAIIHHTECAMLTFTDDTMRTRLREERGANADAVAFLSFTDLRQSVLDDIQAYRESPLLRQDIPVRGFTYNVETGILTEVFSGG